MRQKFQVFSRSIDFKHVGNCVENSRKPLKRKWHSIERARSVKTVQITSSSAIPEFQPLMLLPLFMIITLFGVVLLKRKRNIKK